jgi:hypothetical protein
MSRPTSTAAFDPHEPRSRFVARPGRSGLLNGRSIDMGYEDAKADVKETMRNVDNKAKETWRRADGNESPSDKVANAGDDIRDALGNAGDEMRRTTDDDVTDRPL